MNIFCLFPLFTALLVFFVGVIAYTKSHFNQISKNFFIFCLTIFLWQFSYGIAFYLNSKPISSLWLKIGYTGVIFTSAALCPFALELLNNPYKYKLSFVSYFMSFLFSGALWFTNYFISAEYYEYFWGVYPKASTMHPFFVLYMNLVFSGIIFLLFFESFREKSKQLHTQRFKYVGGALSIGAFASIDFIANYGYKIYPCGWIFVILYILIIAYTIIKYRLMDINLILTRTSIFIAVYSLVLGIPFAIAFGCKERLIYAIGDNWWLAPLISSTVLATAGPFIYLYIQKRAEDRLFQEQKRYQSTLRQASAGMGRIKDITRLVNLIVHIVSRTVRLEHALVYLFDSESHLYQLRAARAKLARFKTQQAIENNSAIIKHLIRTRNPIVYEEIKQQTQDYGDMNLARLESDLVEVNAELVVPCFIDDRLLAVIVLGKKVSNDLYSESDLAVFSILANQAALAMENAMFYEEMKNTHAQLMKAEKMATIGTMADGLSHQINNRLHALGFIAGDALDTIKLKKDIFVSPEAKEVMVDLEHALHRIEDNVTQGGEIVRGLLKYTRKGEEGFSDLDFDQLVNAAIEMTQFKIKPGEMQIVKEYGKDMPKINGNFTQLQEVFFNLIDNAYDAMMQRKSELKEKGYAPVIKISAGGDNNGNINIRFEDNGIGIKEEDKARLFTPFFTTKLSSKKGTGLGLYVIQKLIEENHGGKVVYNSVYKQGTNVLISLHAPR